MNSFDFLREVVPDNGEKELKKEEKALLNDIKSEGACGKNIGWILCSAAGGICMGTGAFIYASNYSEYGFAGLALLGPIPIITTSVVKISREVYFRCKTGSWLRP